ncbi:MAG TPA: siderophore-interacting protein [Leifsonia sp.]|nr:siderophore-interacting protein [Leifsonia sp.]
MSSARTTATGSTPTRVDFTSFAASVSRIQRLGNTFVRVTFCGYELADFYAAGLDQRIKLIFPVEGTGLGTFPRGGADWFSAWRELPQDERCPMRTYTVRAARPELREIDIDFVAHGDVGPATRWVNRARVGDNLLLVGPDARTLVPGDGPVGGVEFRPGSATRVLLAGDETAAPAICSIVESLSADTCGQVFIEVATEADILPLRAPERVSVSWLARERRSNGEHGAALGRAVRAWASEMIAPGDGAAEALTDVDAEVDILWDVPNGFTGTEQAPQLYAWIAGEAGCIKELRRFLVRDAGIHRDDVAFMGYWRAGRPEN